MIFGKLSQSWVNLIKWKSNNFLAFPFHPCICSTHGLRKAAKIQISLKAFCWQWLRLLLSFCTVELLSLAFAVWCVCLQNITCHFYPDGFHNQLDKVYHLKTSGSEFQNYGHDSGGCSGEGGVVCLTNKQLTVDWSECHIWDHFGYLKKFVLVLVFVVVNMCQVAVNIINLPTIYKGYVSDVNKMYFWE